MKTNTDHIYSITNSLAVDYFCKIKIADITYTEGSDRPDDSGSIWVAPVIKTGWNAPLGLLAIYASTNGDPVLLGTIEDGDVNWCDETSETPGLDAFLPYLQNARWITEEGYVDVIKTSIGM